MGSFSWIIWTILSLQILFSMGLLMGILIDKIRVVMNKIDKIQKKGICCVRDCTGTSTTIAPVVDSKIHDENTTIELCDFHLMEFESKGSVMFSVDNRMQVMFEGMGLEYCLVLKKWAKKTIQLQ